MYLSGTDSSACGNPNRFWEMLNGQRDSDWRCFMLGT